jgi:hypothetical protein
MNLPVVVLSIVDEERRAGFMCCACGLAKTAVEEGFLNPWAESANAKRCFSGAFIYVWS